MPLPVYRGFQLLADAGDELLDVGALNMSGPVVVMATRNRSTRALHLFLSNYLRLHRLLLGILLVPIRNR